MTQHRRSANGHPLCSGCGGRWPCTAYVELDRELRFGPAGPDNLSRVVGHDGTMMLDAGGNLFRPNTGRDLERRLDEREIIRDETVALPALRDRVETAWKDREVARLREVSQVTVQGPASTAGFTYVRTRGA